MEIQGSNTAVSDASAGLRAAKLANNQQEQQGKATLQLLESAAGVPQASSANPALGSTVDTYA